MRDKRISPTLPFILLTGFALRLYRLGAQSLWYDETVSAVLAKKSALALIAHTARDIHPPGYYLLLHGWALLAGYTEFALAFFSLLFGVLLIAATYQLGVRLVGRRGALWGAALVAFSPYNLWYSQEVRMYTLGAFLGVLVVYFALRVWGGDGQFHQWVNERHRKTVLLCYVLTAALGLYVLYYFAFLLLALNLFLLVVLWQHGYSWQRFRDWLLANIAVVALYLPWIPVAWRQATNPPVPPWRSAIPLWKIAVESWTALSLGESVSPGQVWWVLVVVGVLFVLGLKAVSSLRRRILLVALPFLPLAIILLVPLLTGSPLYHVRYLFTYAPAFYLIIGAGLAWLWQQRRVLALGGALVWLAGSTLAIFQLHTNPLYAADDLRGAVQFLQEKWHPGDVILVNAGYTYTALQVYFTAPVDGYGRLTDFYATRQTDPYRPLILMTGTVDGAPSLGWGDPRSDFFAMSRSATVAALERVSQHYPRIWMLRAYDTVTDPDGVIRHWLAEHTHPFENYLVTGPSNFRVQGFATGAQPSPPQVMEASFDDKFQLRGIVPLGQQYHPGDTIYVTWWLRVLTDARADPPYAVSLKLWNAQGKLAAQTDEWAMGNLYFSPQWRVGDVIRYPMRLQLPADLSPGHYWLDMIVYRSDTGNPLSVVETGKSGVTLGEIVVVERE